MQEYDTIYSIELLYNQTEKNIDYADNVEELYTPQQTLGHTYNLIFRMVNLNKHTKNEVKILFVRKLG